MKVDNLGKEPGLTILEEEPEDGGHAMKLGNRIWGQVNRLLMASISAILVSATAMSQSLLSEGLDALFDDVSNGDEFGEAWDTLYEVESELRAERASPPNPNTWKRMENYSFLSQVEVQSIT